MAADLSQFNPPEIHSSSDVLHNNILVFGWSGSGVSSCVNTFASCVQPPKTTSLIRALSRVSYPGYPSKTRLTTSFLKHHLSFYNPQLRVNLWESWGISNSADGNNYDSIELDIILQGMLPEKTAMPKDAKSLSAILAQSKKPNNLNAIHAVAFCVPQDVLFNLQTDDLSRIKNALKQIRERGRDPVLIITKSDGAGASLADCAQDSQVIQEARELAAGIFGFPIEDVVSLINYNSPSYEKTSKRVPELDSLATSILKKLLHKSHDFQNQDPSTIAFIKGKNVAVVAPTKAGSLASLTPENAAQKIAEQHKQVEQAKRAAEIEESLETTSGLNFNNMLSQVEAEVGNEVSAVSELKTKDTTLPSATPSDKSSKFSAASSNPSPVAVSLTESTPSPVETITSARQQNASSSPAKSANDTQAESKKQQAEFKAANVQEQKNSQNNSSAAKESSSVKQQVTSEKENQKQHGTDEATLAKIKAIENNYISLSSEIKEVTSIKKTVQSLQAEVDKLSMSTSLTQQELISIQQEVKIVTKNQDALKQSLSQQQHDSKSNSKQHDNKDSELVLKHQNSIDSLNERFKSLESGMQSLNTKFSSKIESIESDVAKQQHSNAPQENEPKIDIEKVIEPLKEELNRLKQRLEEIGSKRESQTQPAAAAPATTPQPKDFTKDIRELQKTMDMTQAKLESIERTTESLNEQVQKIQKTVSSLSASPSHPLAQSTTATSLEAKKTEDDFRSELEGIRKRVEESMKQAEKAEKEAKIAQDTAKKADEKASAAGCKCVVS